MVLNFLVSGEGDRDFSKFMEILDAEEERGCYEAFYDSTSNAVLRLETCPVCGEEKLAREGDETNILSDPSVVEVLQVENAGSNEVILEHLLERNEGGVNCWMCFECSRALERRTLPKFALANNLSIGDIPFEL